jgi:xanthine dehydrogenase accessory factor
VLNIWQECARVADAGKLGALITVVRRRGSLPMSATARMLVTAGGARFGTIGGGCMEAQIVEQALDVMERRAPEMVTATYNSSIAAEHGLTCGGTAEMLVEPVFGVEPLVGVYRAASDHFARGEPAVIVTGLKWDDSPEKALVSATAEFGAARRLLRAMARKALVEESEAGVLRDNCAIDPVLGPPPLVVFGGGHVGAAIARAATFAGWRVTVVDDRQEFTDPERYHEGIATVCCDFHDVITPLDLNYRTYAVVATRGHQHDALIVDQLARRDLKYIGMLGSRRKVALTWKLLRNWGVPADALRQVHAPVGLAIGADSPEEIAVSVVAELIAVRRRVPMHRSSSPATLSSASTRSHD